MSRIVLPADDAVLPTEPVQWWYWTGHLASGARRFGFEACFFAFNGESFLTQAVRDHLEKRGFLERIVVDLLSHVGLQIAEVALTDIDGGAFDHRMMVAAGMPRVEAGRYSFHLPFPLGESAVAEGGGGQDRIAVRCPDWRLDLTLVNDDARHPPALHYNGDRHDYAFGGYTYYYSRPCQVAAGRLTVGDEPFEVSGHAWFDRQYGDLASAVKLGWQWFAIQLDDDTQIMMFDFNSVPEESRGAIVKGTQQTELGPTEFTVEVLRYFTDPGTGVRFPSQWRATIGGRRLVVTPLMPNQVMREPAFFPTYWEGDCSVEEEGVGMVGKAYVELQGFKKAPA